MACQNNHAEIVGMLLACDSIAVNQARTDVGSIPLHGAAYSGHFAIGQQLVAFGADMTIVDNEGNTPFQDAMDETHPELAAWLGAVK
jgi:ankyrin repeat protein